MTVAAAQPQTWPWGEHPFPHSWAGGELGGLVGRHCQGGGHERLQTPPGSHQIPAAGTASRCLSHPGGMGEVLVISPLRITPTPTACGAFASLELEATPGTQGDSGDCAGGELFLLWGHGVTGQPWPPGSAGGCLVSPRQGWRGLPVLPRCPRETEITPSVINSDRTAPVQQLPAMPRGSLAFPLFLSFVPFIS